MSWAAGICWSAASSWSGCWWTNGRWRVFADSGNAFDQAQVDPRTGVGIGIRWRSPVGPVRLDIAHPLNDSKDAFRIHFSMGPEL